MLFGFSRSMYPYNAPGAFVPHSAINLSVKPGETGQPGSSTLTSLDLSMTDAAASSSYLSQVSSCLQNVWKCCENATIRFHSTIHSNLKQLKLFKCNLLDKSSRLTK